MKRIVATFVQLSIFLCILFFSIIKHDTIVKAGTLNLTEADIVEFLKGTWEVDGTKYQVKSGYIQQAKNYLLQDNVDLAKEQKSEVISMFFSNIQQGIDEGYLEKIEVNHDATDDISPPTKEDNNDENSQPPDGNEHEASEGETTSSSFNELFGELGITDDLIDSDNMDGEFTNEEITTSDDSTQQTPETDDTNALGEMKEENQGVEDNNNDLSEAGDYIKDTGFIHSHTISILILIIGAYTLSILAAIQCKRMSAKRYET